MQELIVLPREQLLMLLGEFALPRGDEDCASVAQELIRRLDEMEVKMPPANWL